MPHSSIKEPVLNQTLQLPDLPIQLWMCKLKSNLSHIKLTKQNHSTSVQLPPVCSLHSVGELNQLKLSPHAASHPIQLPADMSTSVALADQGQWTRLYMGTAVYCFLEDSCRKSSWMISHSTRYCLLRQIFFIQSFFIQRCDYIEVLWQSIN